jgi:serine protease
MKTIRYFILIFLFCLVLIYPVRALARSIRVASPQTNNPFQPPTLQDIPTNQIIVKYKNPAIFKNLSDPIQDMEVQRLSATAGIPLEYKRSMSGDAEVFRLPERLPAEELRLITQRLMTLPEVEYAEPDAIMQHTLTPNDPRYSDQWHYFAPTAGNYGINAPTAWNITTGAASIVAAVVDTGITNHADLSGRTVPGYDFIDDAAVANDGDGRDSNPSDPGDWITAAENASGYFKGCQITNSSWHGTHTAGTIGAASNNSLGVAGVNWNSKILAVRVLGKCGGYDSDIVDGMRWAAGLSVSGIPNNANPAKVINISLGGPGSCDTTFQNAINAITAAGTTVVVAAGNSNSNASGFMPANCNGVITVAATNRNGSRASYSNYGSVVEISAPGGQQSSSNDPNGILSTLNTGTQGPAADSYQYYQGTSMAAPHVTGVASLLYSLNPQLTPTQVLQILQNTATAFPGGSTCNTSNCGSGIVNAGSAVQSIAAPGAFNKTSPSNGATGISTSPTLSWGSSSNAASYEYCYDTSNNSTCNGSWTSTGSNTSVGLSGLSAGTTYSWHVRAVNGGGTTYSNSDTWWSFTTQASSPPGAFNKTSPSNSATGVATNPTLSWGASSGATGYEYCYDTSTNSTCNGSWTSTGSNTSVGLSGLSAGTTYSWHVRAINGGGTTYSNSDTWWNFTTQASSPPGAFNKTSPPNGATSVATNPTLSWGTSSGAASYEYCYDTSNNSTCNGSWTSTGSNTSVDLGSLSLGTTYFWQVRANNGSGTTYADNDTWWGFTTSSSQSFDIFLPYVVRSSCTAFFSDDFSNPSSGWPSGQGIFADYGYLNGEYQILITTTSYPVRVKPSFQAENFSTKVDVRNTTNLDGSYGIAFGIGTDVFGNWAEFYTFEITSDGHYNIWRYDFLTPNGQNLASGTSNYINTGSGTNAIGIERNGTQIQVYANGHLLDSVTDSNYTGSRYIGLTASTKTQSNQDFRFDNFIVNPTGCGTSDARP